VIRAVAVVIPAHDEETLLPACLTAVGAAARALERTPVCIVVAADTCTDQTAALARSSGAVVVEISGRNVGAARRAGMIEALRQFPGLDPSEVWLATTDADTVVPPGWLRQQLAYAALGWDVVVGTIAVADWTEHPPEVPFLFRLQYASEAGSHPHVHGANLGFTAEAYLAAGGFRPHRTAEDHALVKALEGAGRQILRTTRVSVVTSARRIARAPEGLSHRLATLAGAACDRRQHDPASAGSDRLPPERVPTGLAGFPEPRQA
jgi:glycosyltransferase involved in cell wall biosynthesis